MGYAVIDVGTNTIRAVHYDENCKAVNETVFESTILNHTKDEMLTEDGILALSQTLKSASDFFMAEGLNKIDCFATSAMRDVKNFDEVFSRIKKSTNIEIRILDEEEEALCDFLSIKFQLGEDCDGTGIDLGGGSCQIISFEKGNMYFHCSEKIGVKRLLNKFGEMNAENEGSVREYIRDVIKNIEFKENKNAYVMGGSAKKLKRVAKTVYKCENINSEIFKVAIDGYYNKDVAFKMIAGMDYHKLPFACVVIDEICKKIKADKIFSMSGGVREGFIKYNSAK